MSRWTAPSDLDYEAEQRGTVARTVARTCRGCGRDVYIHKAEPYQVHVWCGPCVSATVTRATRQPVTNYLFDAKGSR